MTSSTTDYGVRMARVAALIEDCLENQTVPDLKALAGAAALSPFHFHRVYRLLTGERVAQTVRRLRLAVGVRSMEEEGASVTAAAQRAGYSSSQSFGRALKAETGVTATQFDRGDLPAASDALDLRPGRRHGLELVSLQPMRVAARTYVGPYEALNRGYAALFETLSSAIGPDGVLGVFGIPIDDPRDVEPSEHRFECCMALGRSAAGLTGVAERVLPHDLHAVLRHNGSYASLPGAVDDLYLAIIEDGLAFRDEPTHVHYVDQPRSDGGVDAEDHISDIRVPVAGCV
ncbi:MAG: helix-turn-helix domain-containing protein [Sphingomonas sp.]|uniref:AraC family transcriptional regulator n=1 Tax=Sphingomonas sp. TaxID=28214 RepID=UPI0011F426F7|nr:GyrI-like domain-containing protein [Sphingomonas sp.]THD34452.1 MAG: helix-turn-helix domain-containing protein [Sphingomonas sp.]